MDGGAWWTTVHCVAESQTWLKRLGTHRPFYVNINSTCYEKQLFSKMFSEKSSSKVAQSSPTLRPRGL